MPKIISGKYKGRILPIAKSFKFKPSKTNLKESIFSILSSGAISEFFNIRDAFALDLFAGSGVLAFEALSRGAKKITLVDNNLEHLKLAKSFASTINALKDCTFLNLDATNLPHSNQIYDLVFIDPPYFKNLVPIALNQLIKKKWVDSNSVIVIELAKKEELNLENNKSLKDVFEILTERIYGNTKLIILKLKTSSVLL